MPSIYERRNLYEREVVMNLTIWQIIFLALLQGVTELFPISSLGHTVILPGLFGGGDLVRDDRFLPLIVALHLGTSIALVIYFWRDWFQVGRTLITSIKEGEVHRGTQEWVSFLIIIGCLPAGLLGIFLEKPLKLLFASPLVAATFLVVNGSVLFAGELIRRQAEAQTLGLLAEEQNAPRTPPAAWATLGIPQEKREALGLPPRRWEAQVVRPPVALPQHVVSSPFSQHEWPFRPLASLSWKEALIVGLAQSLALLPGISRSGVTMVAGLGVRLSHTDAARYSFLIGNSAHWGGGASRSSATTWSIRLDPAPRRSGHAPGRYCRLPEHEVLDEVFRDWSPASVCLLLLGSRAPLAHRVHRRVTYRWVTDISTEQVSGRCKS